MTTSADSLLAVRLTAAVEQWRTGLKEPTVTDPRILRVNT
jgi:hypothetical protein